MRSESPGSPAAPDGNSKKTGSRAILPWLIRNPDVRSGRMAVLRMLPGVSLPITLGLGGYLLFETALSLGFTLGTGALVGSLPAAIGSGPNSPATRRLILVLVVVAALFFLQHLLGSVQFILSETLGRRMNGRLRARVMEASLRPPGVAHLEDPDMLDKVSLAQGVATSSFTPGGAVIGLSNNIRQILTMLGQAGLVVWLYSWWLGIALVATALILRSRLLHEFLKTVKVLTGQTQALRRSSYFRDQAITPAAAKEIRIFGMGEWILDRFREHWLGAMTKLWRERREGSKVALVWSLPHLALSAIAFVLVGRAAIRGEVSLTRLAILLQAVGGAGSISISQNDLQVEYGAAAVRPALELEKITADPNLDLEGERDPAELPKKEIRFEEVSFRYPGRDSDVFLGLDLSIPAGRSLAVVGENGAGKTTLVKLLSRLYDPTAGRITVDGIELKELDPRKWQSRIATIFQDYIQYELPAADNVGFGNLDHSLDIGALEGAARRAGALEIVESLAHGWETILSRKYKEGAELSGGQWQRVALARALFSVDGGAGILVLDEPTANLDVRAEAEIFDRFLDLTRGLTTILISHRFSTVRRADLICVLERGQVTEIGTHEQLMANGRLYAEMFTLQASRFVDGPAGPAGTEAPSEEGSAHA